MRVLTIRQPWAGAIFARGKNVENRTWRTDYRGPLVIHSASRIDVGSPVVAGRGRAWEQGVLLGVVELIDCVRDAPGDWAMPDCWHWVIRRPKLCKIVMPAKGQLGLWNLNSSLRRAIEKQLR
jgi:hypothetical protein